MNSSVYAVLLLSSPENVRFSEILKGHIPALSLNVLSHRPTLVCIVFRFSCSRSFWNLIVV